jgi:hypothetical protein
MVLDELDPRVSGTGRTRLWSHLGDHQDLQQGGNLDAAIVGGGEEQRDSLLAVV